MPVDLPLPACSSAEDLPYGPAPSPALSPALSSRTLVKAKKQVSFADQRGLSLTRVRLFSQFNDTIVVPCIVQETLGSAPSVAAEEEVLVLDFSPPSSDYLLLRQRLSRNLVSLEHCALQQGALSGTIKVLNVAFHKSVTLRVTFDSWRSHRDVACEHVRDASCSPHCDTFSFHVALPRPPPPPHEHVEFAVCYEVAGRQHWDSNHGRNYGLARASSRGRHRSARDFGIHFERYGSPTCSHGLLPDWPSYAGHENTGPYY